VITVRSDGGFRIQAQASVLGPPNQQRQQNALPPCGVSRVRPSRAAAGQLRRIGLRKDVRKTLQVSLIQAVADHAYLASRAN
jgi:hypothetical protein